MVQIANSRYGGLMLVRNNTAYMVQVLVGYEKIRTGMVTRGLVHCD